MNEGGIVPPGNGADALHRLLATASTKWSERREQMVALVFWLLRADPVFHHEFGAVWRTSDSPLAMSVRSRAVVVVAQRRDGRYVAVGLQMGAGDALESFLDASDSPLFDGGRLLISLAHEGSERALRVQET